MPAKRRKLVLGDCGGVRMEEEEEEELKEEAAEELSEDELCV